MEKLEYKFSEKTTTKYIVEFYKDGKLIPIATRVFDTKEERQLFLNPIIESLEFMKENKNGTNLNGS